MSTPENISLEITATSPVLVGQKTTLTIDVHNIGLSETASDTVNIFVVGCDVSDAQSTLLFSDLILAPMSVSGMDELTPSVPMMAPGDFVFTAISKSNPTVSDSVTVHVSSSAIYATDVCAIRQIQEFSDACVSDQTPGVVLGTVVSICEDYAGRCSYYSNLTQGIGTIYHCSDGTWIKQGGGPIEGGTIIYDLDFVGNTIVIGMDNTAFIVVGGNPQTTIVALNDVISINRHSDQAGWLTQAEVSNSDCFGFGRQVVLSSDQKTLLVSTPFQDLDESGNIKTPSTGTVHVFYNSDGTWSRNQKLGAGSDGDWFGISLALSADGHTALIGASQHSNKRGCAYIFTNSDGTWIQGTPLFANNGTSGDLFGSASALSEDGTVAVISAINNSGLGGNANLNSVYIFVNSDGMWNQYQELSVSDTSSFGSSISMSHGTIVIGAPNDGRDSAEGEVFVFKQSSSNGLWQQVNRFSGLDSAANDTFGISIDIFGNKIIVGAPGHNSNTGATYFFEISPPRLLSNVIAPVFIETNTSCSIQFDLYLSDLSHHAHIRFAMNDSDYYTSDFTTGTNTLSVTVPAFSSDVSDLHCSLFAVDAQNSTNSDEVVFVISLIPSSSDMNDFSPPSFKSLDSMMSSLFSQMFNNVSSQKLDFMATALGSQNVTDLPSLFNPNSVYSNLTPSVSTSTRFDLFKGVQEITIDPSLPDLSSNSGWWVPSFTPIKNNSDTQTHFEISGLTILAFWPQSYTALTSNISGSFNLTTLASDTTAQVIFMLNGKITYQSDYSSGTHNFSFNVPLERPGYSVYVVGTVNGQGRFVSNQQSGIISMPILATAPSPFYIETYVQDSDTVNITVVEQASGSASDIIIIVCEQVSDNSYIFVSAFSDTIPVPGGFTVSTAIGAPGKYKFTATSAFNNYQKTTEVYQLGTQSKHQVTWHLLGSFLSMIFNLPASFTSAFPGVSDYKTILSDMYLFAKQASFAMELTITEQSDVLPSDASILGEKKAVIAYANSDGALLFVDKAGQFTLGLQNFMTSDVLIQYYDKTHGVLSDKFMTDNSGSVVINTITQLGTDLEIVNIHSDLQSDNSILFTINIRNNGPYGVSDAFLKFASSFGDDVTQNIDVMNMNASDIISFTFSPGDLGDCTIGFDIDSITLVNTNTTSHILKIGPNLEITLAADLTTTTANSDVQLTATIINTGLIGMPSDTLTVLGTCKRPHSNYPSDIFPFALTALPQLIPNTSDVITYSDFFLPAGQFVLQAQTAKTDLVNKAFTSNTVTIDAYGTSQYGETQVHLDGCSLDLVLDLPPQFIQTHSDLNTSDIQSLFSDMYDYAQTHTPFVVGLLVSDQSDVFDSDALILQGQQTVYISVSDEGLYASNKNFTLGLLNFMSSDYSLFYSDRVESFTDGMETMQGSVNIKTVVYTQDTASPSMTTPYVGAMAAIFVLVMLLAFLFH